MANRIEDFSYYDESGNEIQLLKNDDISQSLLLTQSFENHFGIEMEDLRLKQWYLEDGNVFHISGFSDKDLLYYDVSIHSKKYINLAD